MNALKLSGKVVSMEPYLKSKPNYRGYLVIVILLLFWPVAQRMVTSDDEVWVLLIRISGC